MCPQVPANDGYWNTQAAFYRDLGAYRALLETPGCLRWDAAFTLIGGLGTSWGHPGEGLGSTGSVGHRGELFEAGRDWEVLVEGIGGAGGLWGWVFGHWGALEA